MLSKLTPTYCNNHSEIKIDHFAKLGLSTVLENYYRTNQTNTPEGPVLRKYPQNAENSLCKGTNA